MFKTLTKRQRNAILAGACLMFAYGLTNNALGYLVEPVTATLGCSRASFNLYYTIMSVLTFVSAPFFGQLFNRVPVRRILTVGAILGAACFVAFSFCSVIPMFYVVAAVMGLFQSGCTNMTAVVIINRSFTTNGGSATGIAMAGTGVCSVVLSLVLPTYIESFGWSNAYLLEAVVWFLVVFAAAILAPAEKEALENTGASDAATKAQPGLTYKQALHSPVLYIFMLTVIVLNMLQLFLQHMPAYFQELGTTAQMAGTIMSIFSIFLIVCKISLGALFDKLGPIKTTIIAMTSFALSMWVMAVGTLPMMFLGAAMSAFGMASSTVLIPLITRHIFGSREYAPIWSMITMATGFGAGFGSPAWGLVYDTIGSYQPAVLIAPIITFVNIAVIVILMKRKLWK